MSTKSDKSTSVPTLTVDDLEQLAERVDRAVAEVQGMEPSARSKAMAMKSTIEEFHKIGLTQIVRKLKNDDHGKQLLFELIEDPTVYALFTMHGLVRADLKTRVQRTIEMVRPYMQSHGGDVTLVDVQEKTAYVRLDGNCNGCSMSTVTLRNTVEESLREYVPEIENVEVVANEPNHLVQLAPASTSDSDHGWIEGPRFDDIPEDKAFSFEHGDNKILLIKTHVGLRAFRNACAHQGLPLDGGLLDADAGTITCPWHGFQFDCDSGECFTAPQCQLEGFPLRVVNDRVMIRPA